MFSVETVSHIQTKQLLKYELVGSDNQTLLHIFVIMHSTSFQLGPRALMVCALHTVRVLHWMDGR